MITTQEFTTTIQYLLYEGVIYLGEPQIDNTALVCGEVTRNVDGNTIHINDANTRIPLVDVQSSGNVTMPHVILAKLLYPMDSPAKYDIDNTQKQDVCGRTLALVYYNIKLHLGEIMMGFGLGWINEYWCTKSEFVYADWTRGACW